MKTPKQLDESKHHHLHLILNDIAKEADYLQSDIKGALQLSQDIYDDYVGYMEQQQVHTDPLNTNCFGIKYETVGNDSIRGDWHTIWFKTKYFRDAVFSDWENDLYWDEIFDTELKYPTPKPNLCKMIKVFSMNGKQYVENDGEPLRS